MENPVKTSLPPLGKSSSLWDWFIGEFYPRYEKQVLGAAGAIILVVLGYFLWNYNHQRSEIADNKKLGAAYVYIEKGQFGEAEKALTLFVAQGHTNLAQDKANLYLGKTYYEQQKYDQAQEAYGKVGKGSKNTRLLYLGALHGKAACQMQKKDYVGAIQTLDQFIALGMIRAGNPKENLAGKEVVDLTPAIPNALWKEALCYRELGQMDKVKATVEKLQKVYPDSREAQDGAKLLAMVE